MDTATIRARDLSLVLAAAKLRRLTNGRVCQLCALSEAPIITTHCGDPEWFRQRVREDLPRYGLSPARCLPMQRGHIGSLVERIQRHYGRREVLRTWGLGMRALLAEPRYVLNGGSAA